MTAVAADRPSGVWVRAIEGTEEVQQPTIREEAMHVQVVTYELRGMSENEYIGIANRLAPRYSTMPGLQAKVWLDHAQPGRYGAVYFWDSREYMERYKASDLFEPRNPNFDEVTSASFDVLENLTRATQPVLELVEGRFRPGADAAARRAASTDGATVAGTGGTVTAAAKSAAETATTAVSKAAKAASSTASKATKAATDTATRASRAATGKTPTSTGKTPTSTKAATKPPSKPRPRGGAPAT